jgi:hypothetical protein
MKRFFKRLKAKAQIGFRNFFNPKVKDYDDNQIKSSAICRRLINHPNSVFLIAPLSNKRYIKNDKLKMFIVLSDCRLNITNHIYNYDIVISSSLSIKLCQMFDNKVEGFRQEFEQEIYGQIQHSLGTILKKLN